MRTVCKISLAVALLAVTALTAGCGDDDTGGNDNWDGSVDSGDATDMDANVVDADTDAVVQLDSTVTPDASPTDCWGLGTPCTDPGQCCSDRCEMDSMGETVCQPGDGCLGTSETCETASQCCTLFCDGGACAEGGICEPTGGTCDEASDCCGNDCDTTASECLDSGAPCQPLGDICSSDGNCCSGRCAEIAPGDLRCQPIGPCASEDEVCTADSECCNNSCADGLCEALGGCTTVYEPCSGGGECCSGICGDPGTGYPVCLYIGGCTVMGEICQTNEECCSFGNSNLPDTACSADGSAMRCVDPPGCVDDGELCGFASSNNCCSGGSDNCMPTSMGVSRCFFSDTECIPTAGECSFSDECCDGVCAPDPNTGTLVCNPGCIPEDDQCTTDADCCSGNCNLEGICGPDEDPCVPLGGACVLPEDCCDPTYLCENGTCAPYVP
jgi:hypothetical protein